MSGQSFAFSESDLAATVKAYDPAKHEAPLVVGHPTHDAPAYGWVKSLAFADGLNAEPIQVDPAFAEMVADGKFKKISASFYAPDSPSNPVPGVYYLRHVGFLGAQAPAVKGLRNPKFADSEKGVIEFSEWDDVTNASLWRRLRDWMIGEKGIEIADSIIPDYQVSSLEQAAQDEVREAQAEDTASTATPAAQFSEHVKKGDQMSAKDRERLAELEAKNKEQQAQIASFAEAEKKRAADARHAGNVAFAEGLVKEGKLLPAHKDVTVATLDSLSAQEQVIEFGEGDAKKPLLDAYKDSLKAGPKLVEFAEVAAAEADDKGIVNFAAPSGYDVDADRLALHSKAVAYQAQHKVSYDAALTAVSA